MTQIELVNSLERIVEKRDFDYSVDDYNVGLQCAIECANDVIETHKELFIKETNQIIDCTDYIEDCINNIIWILNETLEDKKEKSDFNIAYTKTTNKIIDNLKEILKDT
jgi:hypothetical protein